MLLNKCFLQLVSLKKGKLCANYTMHNQGMKVPNQCKNNSCINSSCELLNYWFSIRDSVIQLLQRLSNSTTSATQ